jgi:hypothetical protein
MQIAIAIGAETGMLGPSKMARLFQGMGNLQVNLFQ